MGKVGWGDVLKGGGKGKSFKHTESHGDRSLFERSRALSGHYFGGDADDGQVLGYGSGGGSLKEGEGAEAVVWKKILEGEEKGVMVRLLLPWETFGSPSFLV